MHYQDIKSLLDVVSSTLFRTTKDLISENHGSTDFEEIHAKVSEAGKTSSYLLSLQSPEMLREALDYLVKEKFLAKKESEYFLTSFSLKLMTLHKHYLELEKRVVSETIGLWDELEVEKSRA